MTKSTITGFLTRTQKATAALAGAAAAVSAATFIPAPWGGYAAMAGVVLTWVLAYVFPFVQEAVEAFPDDVVSTGGSIENLEDFDQTSDVEEPSPAKSAEPLVGEIIEPETDEIPIVVEDDTAGIPVIDGEPTLPFVPPFTGAIRVSDVLARLAAEGEPVAASLV